MNIPRSLAINMPKMSMVVKPLPMSASSMARRRSHRSMSVPAMGDSTTMGASAKKDSSANCVVERVSRKTFAPTPKDVRPEPRIEMSWPNQVIQKTRMGWVMVRRCARLIPSLFLLGGQEGQGPAHRTTGVRAGPALLRGFQLCSSSASMASKASGSS
ncbi:hypothetical protein COEX109129_19190 [Corallococcus exiguus]